MSPRIAEDVLTEQEQRADKRITKADSALEKLIRDKAPRPKILAAKRHLDAVRAEVDRDERDREELARIEQSVRRDQEREKNTALVTKRREAEAKHRASQHPRLTLEYAGLRVTVAVDGVADNVITATTLEGMRQAIQTVRNHFTVAIGAAGQRAIGKQPIPAADVRVLTDQIAESLRHALKNGQASIATGRTD